MIHVCLESNMSEAKKICDFACAVGLTCSLNQFSIELPEFNENLKFEESIKSNEKYKDLSLIIDTCFKDFKSWMSNHNNIKQNKYVDKDMLLQAILNATQIADQTIKEKQIF